MDVERSRSGMGTWQRRCSSRALRGGASGSGRGEVERRRSSRKLSSSCGRKKKNSSEAKKQQQEGRGRRSSREERVAGAARHLIWSGARAWGGLGASVRGGGTDREDGGG